MKWIVVIMNGFWHDMDCCHELDFLFGNGLLSGNRMNASQGSTLLYYLRVNRATSCVAKSHRPKRRPVLHLLHPIVVLSQAHVKLLNPFWKAVVIDWYPFLYTAWRNTNAYITIPSHETVWLISPCWHHMLRTHQSCSPVTLSITELFLV